MQNERRQQVRYEDVAHVDAPEICVFPGMLCNISLSGCKVKFPAALNVDMEKAYDLKLTPTAEKGMPAFTVQGSPNRVRVSGACSEVAFSLSCAPAAAQQLEKYISYLAAHHGEPDYTKLIVDTACQFV